MIFMFINMILSSLDYYAAFSPNVRRYVQLAQNRGGARFCIRGAMQD